jgi:hypothetical protein
VLDQQILLASCKSRSAWEKVSRYIGVRELSPNVGFWWKLLEEYYGRDKKTDSVDLEVLRELGKAKIQNPKHLDGILGILDADAVDTSPSNIVAASLGILRNNRAAEFASAAFSGDTKKAQEILSEINELWEKESLDEEAEEVIRAVPAEDIFKLTGQDSRIPILPQSLNVRVGGGVLPGQHILIFGRTEIGKSSFVINLMAGFIRQRQKVLYVGNEDEINGVKARLLCRIIGKSHQEAERDPAGSAALFRGRGGEDFARLVHMQPGSIEAIEREVQEYRPSVLILDQIRNLSASEDGMTRKMESNAIRFRSLLARYNLVGVSVTQASDKSDRNSADLPVWLSAGDVDSSRVGLPAQADLMLGIGGNQDMISRGQRAISICKNKLFSGPQSREGVICNFDVSRNIVS